MIEVKGNVQKENKSDLHVPCLNALIPRGVEASIASKFVFIFWPICVFTISDDELEQNLL